MNLRYWATGWDVAIDVGTATRAVVQRSGVTVYGPFPPLPGPIPIFSLSSSATRWRGAGDPRVLEVT